MFLLGVEPSPERAEALAALRRQVPDAQVIETWDCCPTIELAVEFEELEPLSEAGGPIIMARHRSEPTSCFCSWPRTIGCAASNSSTTTTTY